MKKMTKVIVSAQKIEFAQFDAYLSKHGSSGWQDEQVARRAP